MSVRSSYIDPYSVQVLHVFNRCVRRSFLCGYDKASRKNYSHRKRWLRKKMEYLTGIFAFDIATFAIMSNHFHYVLQSRPDIAGTWTDEEIAWRNMKLQGERWFRKNGTPRKSAQGEVERICADPKEVARLRKKLSNVSKLMKYFDEHIAKRANREDGVKGAFWEGTFGCQVLNNVASILGCMTYVDLNPIRAMLAGSIEDSDFTGAKERIDELRRALGVGELSGKSGKLRSTGSSSCEAPSKASVEKTAVNVSSQGWVQSLFGVTIPSTLDWERLNHPTIGWLSPIEIDERSNDLLGREPNGRRPSRKGLLPISLIKYLELVDWAGRKMRGDKPGVISPTTATALEVLGLCENTLLESAEQFSKHEAYFAATERQGRPERAFA